MCHILTTFAQRKAYNHHILWNMNYVWWFGIAHEHPLHSHALICVCSTSSRLLFSCCRLQFAWSVFFVASLLRHPVRFIKNSTLKLHRFHCQTHTFFHPSGSGVIYFISNQSWYFAGSLELFLLKMKIQYKWIEQRRDEEMWTSSDINHATMKPPKKQSENTNTVQGMRHCNLFHGFLWRNIELFYVQYPYGRQIIFYSWNLDFSAPLRFIHSICIYELCSLLKRRHKHLYCTH